MTYRNQVSSLCQCIRMNRVQSIRHRLPGPKDTYVFPSSFAYPHSACVQRYQMGMLKVDKHIHFHSVRNLSCTFTRVSKRQWKGLRRQGTYFEATNMILCACRLGVAWVIALLAARCRIYLYTPMKSQLKDDAQ